MKTHYCLWTLMWIWYLIMSFCHCALGTCNVWPQVKNVLWGLNDIWLQKNRNSRQNNLFLLCSFDKIACKDTSLKKLCKTFSGPSDSNIHRKVSKHCKWMKLFRITLYGMHIRLVISIISHEHSIYNFVKMCSFQKGHFYCSC